MGQIFSYAALAGIGTLMLEALILLFKTESIERILLSDKKKLLLDLIRVTIIGFGISLILYTKFIEPNMEGAYSYLATFIISWLLGAEIYYITISTIQGIGFGRNYFLEDDQYGKLYLIKSSSNSYILLADKPQIKDSTFSIFKDKSYIEGKKIFSEPRKIKANVTAQQTEVASKSE